MADALDSKSSTQKVCGFKSHLGHYPTMCLELLGFAVRPRHRGRDAVGVILPPIPCPGTPIRCPISAPDGPSDPSLILPDEPPNSLTAQDQVHDPAPPDVRPVCRAGPRSTA